MAAPPAEALPTSNGRKAQQEANPMDTKAGNGWWQASDGYWYPPEARPDVLWQGEACGPHGEQPPGPGWWLASDYQWYPPDAKPGEAWADPVAVVPGEGRPGRSRTPFATVRAVPMPTEPGEAGAGGGAAVSSAARSGGRIDDIAQTAGLDVVKGLVAIFAGMLVLAATKGLSGSWDRVGLVGWLPIAAGFVFVALGAVRFARSFTGR
jgi:hypothetical protein